MKPLSIDSQVALLKVAAKTRVGRNLQHWMQGSAVALALLSALIWNPIPLMLALFLGIVGIAERRAVPNILNALRAYETGVAAPGEVSISTICWDTDTHYHALVREPGRPDWTYEFIPQGWQPETGTHAARIWRLPGREAPVLVATEDGILIPRALPQPEPTRTNPPKTARQQTGLKQQSQRLARLALLGVNRTDRLGATWQPWPVCRS